MGLRGGWACIGMELNYSKNSKNPTNQNLPGLGVGHALGSN